MTEFNYEHWCFLCAVDGIEPPSDAASAARREAVARRAAAVKAHAEAREREAQRQAFLLTQKQARETAELLRRRAAAQRRADREETAPGFATNEQVAARWAYYGGRCWMCGRPADHMDHVKPLAAGGSNWPSNLRPACWPCNFRKGARWPYPAVA